MDEKEITVPATSDGAVGTEHRTERKTVIGEVGEYIVDAPIPAEGAEDQKPKPPAGDDKAAESGEGDKGTPEQQEEKKRSKFQRRLDRQKEARFAAEAEAKVLREQLAELKARPAAASDPKEPQRDQYDDYETYLRAVTKYDAEQIASKSLKTEREERERQEQERGKSSGQEKIAKEWSERESAFQKDTKDYVEIVSAFMDDGIGSLSNEARRAIVESEAGPQLLYHLAQNDEDAERISALTPLRQVAELGKLEAKMTTKAAKPAKTASEAPAPISPAKSGASVLQGYREGMSDAEYREWRKGQGARWAR